MLKIFIIIFTLLLFLILYILFKSKSDRNVFLYWIGKEYKLIKILRNLIYLHSYNGKGYKVHFITDKNIHKYIKDIPNYFDKLLPAHKSDFVRVNVICDYGGIWLDSDTLVMDKLDDLFSFTKNGKDGFFIKENNETICNGVFGSKKQTPIMIEWKNQLLKLLNEKQENISWTEIGGSILQNIYVNNPKLYNNYIVYNGLDNLYPVNWSNCVTEFLDKPYDNYKNIRRDFQPLIILVNSVYKKLEDENKTEDEIIKDNTPLSHFINNSIQSIQVNKINKDQENEDAFNFYNKYVLQKNNINYK